MAPILELKGITKSFPGVLANDHIDLTLEKGEIHALLGENGAGKTTLMNILYGLYTPDEGRIFIHGREVHIHSPNDAIAHGIGMVHQHFMLVPVMTVAENVMLGVESLLWPYSWKGFFRFLAVAGGALSLLLVLSLLLAGNAGAAGRALQRQGLPPVQVEAALDLLKRWQSLAEVRMLLPGDGTLHEAGMCFFASDGAHLWATEIRPPGEAFCFAPVEPRALPWTEENLAATG